MALAGDEDIPVSFRIDQPVIPPQTFKNVAAPIASDRVVHIVADDMIMAARAAKLPPGARKNPFPYKLGTVKEKGGRVQLTFLHDLFKTDGIDGPAQSVPCQDQGQCGSSDNSGCIRIIVRGKFINKLNER